MIREKMKLLFSILLLMVPLKILADSPKGQGLNLYVENDTRDMGGPGSDNAYTNGIKLSYIAADDKIPVWARPFIDHSEILKNSLEDSKSNFGISLGQQIYTPNDVLNPDLIQDDRPYAGWLYVGLSAHFQNEVSSHSAELDIGVVGPESGGSYVQNGYHRMIGYHQAQGWQHQLNTEPTLQLSYQQRVRFFELRDENKIKYFDILPFFGASVGNVFIDTHAGGMIRFGLRLPDDFGSTRPSAADGDNFVAPLTNFQSKPSLYGFVGGRGILVGRNIFLDGNSFRSSHRVTKIPVVFETDFGFSGLYKQWSLTWRFVTRTPEFKEKVVVNSFASISIAYVF